MGSCDVSYLCTCISIILPLSLALLLLNCLTESYSLPPPKTQEYLGMIHNYPDLVQVHSGALGKVTDCEKMKEVGRIDVSV